MPGARFAARDELAEFEWDNQRKDWKRPKIEREVLKKLSERSTINGLVRIAYFVLLLTASALATVFVARINVWLAIPVLYVYYFFYGFWVAIAHELQHKTVFSGAGRVVERNPFLFCADTDMAEPDLRPHIAQAPPPLHDGTRSRP